MKIDLREEIGRHFERCRNLADEAETDAEESYSSRASALKALTDILRDLTKTQAEVINMERFMRIEATTIEILAKYLTPEQQEEFIDDLKEKLNDV